VISSYSDLVSFSWTNCVNALNRSGSWWDTYQQIIQINFTFNIPLWADKNLFAINLHTFLLWSSSSYWIWYLPGIWYSKTPKTISNYYILVWLLFRFLNVKLIDFTIFPFVGLVLTVSFLESLLTFENLMIHVTWYGSICS
jgi:hypothetical protein